MKDDFKRVSATIERLKDDRSSLDEFYQAEKVKEEENKRLGEIFRDWLRQQTDELSCRRYRSRKDICEKLQAEGLILDSELDWLRQLYDIETPKPLTKKGKSAYPFLLPSGLQYG
ncbi:hypothetical protein H0H92_004046 [Tricholoma furcatifolium]|nr:hypothetical protein H0H92_004046 [Tricholoma furcatifolium]